MTLSHSHIVWPIVIALYLFLNNIDIKSWSCNRNWACTFEWLKGDLSGCKAVLSHTNNDIFHVLWARHGLTYTVKVINLHTPSVNRSFFSVTEWLGWQKSGCFYLLWCSVNMANVISQKYTVHTWLFVFVLWAGTVWGSESSSECSCLPIQT